MKEVLEETGIECEPVSLIAVLDGLRLGFARVPMYSIVFHCRMTGGELKGHPLETSAVGFFARDALPQPLAGAHRWLDLAFRAIDGEQRRHLVRPAPRPHLARRELTGDSDGSPTLVASWSISSATIDTSPLARSHASPIASWSTSPKRSGASASAVVDDAREPGGLELVAVRGEASSPSHSPGSGRTSVPSRSACGSAPCGELRRRPSPRCRSARARRAAGTRRRDAAGTRDEASSSSVGAASGSSPTSQVCEPFT